MGDTSVAILGPTPGFDRRTFVSSGFSTKGTLISASAVPHCRSRENRSTLSLLRENEERVSLDDVDKINSEDDQNKKVI